MTSRFVLQHDGDQYSFRLKAAGNSEIILTSECYTRKSSALDGIAAVKACAADSDCFRRRRSRRGDAYFVLKAANGEVVGKSEMYSSVSAREAGIAAVRAHAPHAAVQDQSHS